MSWACAIPKQARRRIMFQSRDTLGEKGKSPFLGPLPKRLEFMESALSVSPRGSCSFAIWQSYFFPLKFSFISSCGSVWGFSELHWCFCRWLLSSGLWCCCGLSQTSVGTDTGRAEPASREGWVRGPSHLFLHFFVHPVACFSLSFCLSSALVVIICP